MSLSKGTTLGPYEIEALLGAGGMGEVYRANDTRLHRTVAVKVLREDVAWNPDLRQRFEREARSVAALNHPHICTLHDIGSEDGTDFLVMEHLEGESLAQRLSRGALPLDEALKIAVEIANALDTAHRQGIVHRDLKPGNIMLTKSGAKLLDFGLAKLRATEMEAAVTAMATQPEPLTGEGTILGTFQYMAPEQLEGKEADARTDIFAFGAVVYEMVTGRKAFEGQSQASLIGAILKGDPPAISELQPLSPASLERVVGVCLEKEPDRRWGTASDLGRNLQWVLEGGDADGKDSVLVTGSRSSRWLRGAIAGVVIGAVVAGLAVWYVKRPESSRLVRFAVSPDEARQLHIDWYFQDVAISPNGELIAYFTEGVGLQELHVRPLGQLSSVTLAAEKLRNSLIFSPNSPFFSPDSQSVGFCVHSRQTQTSLLKRVAIRGGKPSIIGETQGPDGALAGASWGANGTIVFASSKNESGLWRVAAAGGEPEQLTTPPPG